MKLTVLGNNGPFPQAHGACSGYLVSSGDTLLQLDMGTGVLAALTACADPLSLTAILLSHWHFDHTSDLLPFIYRVEGAVAAGHAPIPVYAPVDEQSPVRHIVARCPGFALTDVAPGDVFTLGSVTLRVGAARHPVPAVGYRLEDGAHTLCYTGDTNTLPGLADFARDADLLLADGLFTRALWTEQKPHLSAALCGELAAEASAKRLLVTHLNPSIDPDVLLAEARSSFPGAELTRLGAVYTL